MRTPWLRVAAVRWSAMGAVVMMLSAGPSASRGAPDGVVIATDAAWGQGDSPEPEPLPAPPCAEGPCAAPPRSTPSPLAEILLSGGSTLRVADAVSILEGGPVAPAAGAPAAGNGEPQVSPLRRPIFALTLDGSADPNIIQHMASLSEDFAIRDLAVEQFGAWESPVYEAASAPPRFGGRVAAWAAPAVYSRPLYFEQPNLERYGHHVALCEGDNLTQSALSAAHFFATVPVLPYKLGAERPGECSYVLGHYRPGSCNPHRLLKPRLSLEGLVYEGLTVTGLVFFVP